MTELNIYAIFKAILQKSKVIEGRFAVLPAGGPEINTNTIGQTISDALGSITTSKKWPAALLLPPMEIKQDGARGWSRFKCKMWFLVPGKSVDGQLKDALSTRNTSGHPITYDWKDMRQCAGDFVDAFELVVGKPAALSKIRPVAGTTVFNRITAMGNDNCNGVEVIFDIDIFVGCEMADYEDKDLQGITLDFSDIHPIHRQ